MGLPSLRGLVAAVGAVILLRSALGAGHATRDREGLVALYVATAGSSSWRNDSGGWSLLGNQDHCSWYGVACDGNERVTSLVLRDNGLTGDFVDVGPEFWQLSELQILDLSRNALAGEIPESLANLTSLVKLNLQSNLLSGTLPDAWVEVEDGAAKPLVHNSTHSVIFADLQALFLGNNSISQDAYSVLQTALGWPSLSVLDLRGNRLTGSIDDAFDFFYLDVNGTVRQRSAGEQLSILSLGSNTIEGDMPNDFNLIGSMLAALDVEHNDLSGNVPAEAGNLRAFLASGNPRLSGTSLPEYLQATGDPVSVQGFACPSLEPASLDPRVSSLDPLYASFSWCYCGDGQQGASPNCAACPMHTYRSTADGDSSCLSCPPNSITISSGSVAANACFCTLNFYDMNGGAEDEPDCVACPEFSSTSATGAISVNSCECEPGYFMDSASECAPCPAGTYKPAPGNDLSLCLLCSPGLYSSEVGQSDAQTCVACPTGHYSTLSGASSPIECSACPSGTFGELSGLTSQSMCQACPAGSYLDFEGASSAADCTKCPRDTYGIETGAISISACTACPEGESADSGSMYCVIPDAESGTLIGLYLLIAGIVLTGITLLRVSYSKKREYDRMDIRQGVHMTLDSDMKNFILGQQFWISLFSAVEMFDLMSDLAAYASLLYTAALTGWIKLLYTVVIAFALVASLHGVSTRAEILMDMQRERMHGIAITGNNMLYYEKQFNILQIMTQKKRCRKHVPFDHGNRYLSHHIGVQRLISLNNMRIVIAVFEDIPFLSLNLYLLLTQPILAENVIFMISFVFSIFVLGYKMTLLEKHARLKIRKWNLEAKMDTDTMINKKAARGRRYSWACEICQEGTGHHEHDHTPSPSGLSHILTPDISPRDSPKNSPKNIGSGKWKKSSVLPHGDHLPS